MAWAPSVRAFLKAARRELRWEASIVDRTLMAFIALHMQDKLGAGLSNALSPTIAHSPQYAVRWWTRNGMHNPPDVDPVALLEDKIRRRYRFGVPEQAASRVVLGDAQDVLPKRRNARAQLLITSPPYRGVTDYWNDHWIRLWLLGHNFGKDWQRTSKFTAQSGYRELITAVLQEAKKHLQPDATILVRSDRRRRTADLCLAAIADVWPEQPLLQRPTAAIHAGISNGHGRGGNTAREIDLLIPGATGSAWARSRGFTSVELRA